MMQPMSAEATVVRNYIDWILGLPWYDKTEENYDIDDAEKILDEDHYGLKKVKERILEYLAVQALVEQAQGADPVPRRAARRGQDLARARASRAPRAASSCGCRSAACATRRRSAATGARTSARCPARSSSRCKQGRHEQPGVPARRDRQDVAATSAATRRRRCSRCSTPSRTTPSTTTTSTSTTT